MIHFTRNFGTYPADYDFVLNKYSSRRAYFDFKCLDKLYTKNDLISLLYCLFGISVKSKEYTKFQLYSEFYCEFFYFVCLGGYFDER